MSAIGVSTSLLGMLAAKSNHPRAIIRWSVYGLAVILFWNIGWSPQYELYLIPLIALAFDAPLAAIGSAVALQLLTFLEYPLFLLWAYFYGGSAVWLVWGSTLARYLLLGWLCVWVLRSEASVIALYSRLRSLLRFARVAPAVVGAAALPLTVYAQAPGQTASQTCGPTRSVPVEPLTFAVDADWQVPAGWFFTEAGETPEHGFTIVDDNEAMLWSEFNRLGGWQALGFPASRRFAWHGLLS